MVVPDQTTRTAAFCQLARAAEVMPHLAVRGHGAITEWFLVTCRVPFA